VAWYATTFDVPVLNVVTRLRFNSVNYLAEVWLNGVRLGEHEGGQWRMLPKDLPPWQTVYGYFRR
jgi:hypothetical protein